MPGPLPVIGGQVLEILGNMGTSELLTGVPTPFGSGGCSLRTGDWRHGVTQLGGHLLWSGDSARGLYRPPAKRGWLRSIEPRLIYRISMGAVVGVGSVGAATSSLGFFGVFGMAPTDAMGFLLLSVSAALIGMVALWSAPIGIKAGGIYCGVLGGFIPWESIAEIVDDDPLEIVLAKGGGNRLTRVRLSPLIWRPDSVDLEPIKQGIAKRRYSQGNQLP